MTLLEKMKAEYPGLTWDEIFAYIMCGEVMVNGGKVTDPKAKVKNDAIIELSLKKYVSRGGLKLEKALSFWNIKCSGKVFLDAGSSTGGFTDALLQQGAAGVHSVDVGYNQLSYSLRRDPRVYVHEKTNIMTLDSLDPPADAAVADLSFRSITGAASRIVNIVREHWLIALIKPQFELSLANRADFNGVVTDRKVLLETVLETAQSILNEGLSVTDIILSPVTGRKGNREFFFLIKSGGENNLKNLEETVYKLIFSS